MSGIIFMRRALPCRTSSRWSFRCLRIIDERVHPMRAHNFTLYTSAVTCSIRHILSRRAAALRVFSLRATQTHWSAMKPLSAFDNILKRFKSLIFWWQSYYKWMICIPFALERIVAVENTNHYIICNFKEYNLISSEWFRMMWTPYAAGWWSYWRWRPRHGCVIHWAAMVTTLIALSQ